MRYFLIDRVTEVVVGERARGVKNVTLAEDVFHDHFPDHPVLPGALVVEAASQLAGFLLEVTVNRTDDEPPLRAMLCQIEKAKFHEPVEPGDQLELEVALVSCRDQAAQLTFRGSVAGERVAGGRLTFVLVHIDSERLHAQRRNLYKQWTRHLPDTPTFR